MGQSRVCIEKGGEGSQGRQEEEGRMDVQCGGLERGGGISVEVDVEGGG